jgi:cell wall assembly regulator SMI1
MSTHATLVAALRTLTGWLRLNGAAHLADNLAPKAKTIQFVLLEKKLGFKVPEGLRALWMMHDGQLRATPRFFGPLHFLPMSWVLNERTASLKLLAAVRADPATAKALPAPERDSDRWLPFARHADACLLVEARSGRVFWGDKLAPRLTLVADSVPAWLADYAAKVAADGYQLVEDEEGDAFLAPTA